MPRLIFVRRKIVAAASLTSISFIEGPLGTGTTLDFTNANAGDLLIYLDRAQNSSGTPTSVTPSGFTLHVGASAAIAPVRYNVSYKIATGSETTVTGMNGTADNLKRGYIFRGNVAITSITKGDQADSGIIAGDPGDITLNSDSDTPPLVVIGSFSSSGTVSPSGFSPAEDGTVGTARHITKYKIYNSSPADVTISMDDEGTENYLCGFVLELS